MSLRESLVKLLVLAGGLAFWDLFLKQFWLGFIQAQGVPTFGGVMLGYLMVLAASYLVAHMIIRRVGGEGG